MVFLWSLRDSKSTLVSSNLLSILADLKTMPQLRGPCLSSDFQFSELSYQTFGNRSERTNYNWYHWHLHVS